MSHSGIDPRMEKHMKEAMKDALGEYPAGKLNDADEGALAVGIGHQKGKVVVQFPKAVHWIGFTPEQAIDIAETLVQHARACGCNRPLTLKIG
jgi:hypothetical protein